MKPEDLVDSRPISTGSNAPYGSLLMAVIPFAFAVFFLPLGMRPAPATVAVARPALAFAEYVVDMGPFPIDPRPVVGARFQFTNRSDSEIVISRMDASCGCLSPQIEKKTWAAGETGDLDLRVSTVGQSSGAHEYTLRMEYGPSQGDGAQGGVSQEDPQQQDVEQTALTLAFKVVFPEQKIVVRPRSLLFYQLGDQPIEQDVVVSDHRGDELEIESIEVLSPYVSAKQISQSTDSGTKRFTLRIKVDGAVPAGDTRALVNIRTNDVQFPVVQVPLMIKGPKRPSRLAIAAEPELLILTSADDPQALTGQMQLTGTDGKPVNIRSVKADPAVIQAVYKANPATGGVTVSASVKQQYVTGFNRGMLTIETDEPNRGRLQVPIMLRVTEKARTIGPSPE